MKRTSRFKCRDVKMKGRRVYSVLPFVRERRKNRSIDLFFLEDDTRNQ